MKIQVNSLNKIYYNLSKGEFYLELQNPPIFKTNFLISGEEERENNICIFPFRNFEDEISNLKYRNFILMIKKNKVESKVNDSDNKSNKNIKLDPNQSDIDNNDNDNNDEKNKMNKNDNKNNLYNLGYTFQNLFNSGKCGDKYEKKILS